MFWGLTWFRVDFFDRIKIDQSVLFVNEISTALMLYNLQKYSWSSKKLKVFNIMRGKMGGDSELTN